VIAFGHFETISTAGVAVSTSFIHDWTLAGGLVVRMVEQVDTAYWARLLAG
jgi:hypothetical protein